MSTEAENPNQINIELNEEIGEGVYSNLAVISHSNAEFIIDFIRILPGLPKARVKSRIIMTPQHMKRLAMAIGDNINKFENQFGRIELADNDQGFPPMNFGGPAGMA